MLNRRQFIAASVAALAALCVDGPMAFAASGPAQGGVAVGSGGSKSSGKSAKKNKSKKTERKSVSQGSGKAAQGKNAVSESNSKQVVSGKTSKTATSEQNNKAVVSKKNSVDKRKVSSKRAAQPIETEPDLVPQRTIRNAGSQLNDVPDTMPEAVRDYVIKMRNFDTPATDDIVLPPQGQVLLTSVMDRLNRLQRIVGHGWFYLLGLDEAVKHARRPAVGAFTGAELSFLEELFNADASGYGFLDSKPISAFTAAIAQNRVVKVSGMGNFIYRGQAEKVWKDIQGIMGNDVVLTSGVRGVIKQFHLFLAKAQRNGGNLSLASRSLAPPGYSFHGVGDFDVGQRGFGVRNFMIDFTTTHVFQTLSERGFISLRYPRDNFLGVRFEPWHVKVTA